jgi:outer membrane protein OmpA-like peptidoglycan-associated protein
MKYLILTFSLFTLLAHAQNEIKLPIPIPYKELQTKLYADGKVVLKDIQFDAKNKLLPTSEPQIKEISRLLNAYKKMKVLIVVHTDNSCPLEECIEISQSNAEQVTNALGNDYMVNSWQMTAKGVGFMSPLATNQTEEGKKLNRRVELVLQ